MPRKKLDWIIRNETLQVGERTLLVGVLNVTPDSVADAGRYQDPDRAMVRAVELVDQGAAILEIGAESFRLGSARVSEAEELRRLVPLLKRLRGKLAVPVCVETCKGAVAEKALELGAQIIKDPSGLTLDPALAKVVAQHNAGLVIQHMHGAPETWARMGAFVNALGAVVDELSGAVSRATRAGVGRKQIAIDPGFGMGKRKEQNSEILTGLNQFEKLALPVQVSPSGKQFAAEVPVESDTSTTIAVATAAILRGAHLVRVHDVAAVRPAALVADHLIRQ
jgi:dihydropteroate synthase